PTVPLGRLYGSELEGWLARHGIALRLSAGAQELLREDGRAVGARLRTGEEVRGDWVVSAVPFDRLLRLLPADLAEREEYFVNLRRLETSPITSVHLWYDRPVLSLPHVVLVGCVGQWVFDRGETAAGEHYLQVVVSASRAFRGIGHDEVKERVVDEL